MVDEYLYLVGQAHSDVGWSFYLKKSNKNPKAVLSLSKIASKVKKAEQDLTHLSQMKEQWVDGATSIRDASNSSCIVERSLDQATNSRSLEEEDLVGIETSKQILEKWIGGGELARSVIVLHGMGGLGKTALAAVVYKKVRVKFDCHAWVPVSLTYSKEHVMRRCIMELFRDKMSVPCDFDTMDMTAIIEILKKFLEDKKYLIVLDDVWNPEAYIELFEALSNLKGSRIIITTRSASVAHLASQNRILALMPLSDDDSLELFHKKVFPDQECPKELEDLSKQIVDKCKGLPLAIVSIGSLLRVRDKSKEEWKRIHDQLTWEIINNPTLDHVRNILYLSFFYLPTCLKSCFLYCSLFPEDYTLHRKKVIRLWMAEGFIEKRGQSEMEEVAEGYLNELVHRNMLQLVGRNSFGRMKRFQMHDIVRELAVDLCQRECFGVPCQEDEYGDKSVEKDGRHWVLYKWKKDSTDQSIWSASHLRSIIVLHMSRICTESSNLNLLPLIIEKARYVSVLELNGLPTEKVPDAIGDLFNLRHLGLRDSKVKILPNSIEKLSNLLTLDLAESNIQELPRGITKLKKLRHLFAENAHDMQWQNFRCGSGVCIPKDVGKLADLQTLQAVEVEDEESVRRLGELRQMRSIRIWNIKGIYCEHLSKSLNQMQYLSCLSIGASDEHEILQLNGLALLPPSLEKLCLHGRLMDEALEESPLFEAARQNLYSLWLCWSQLRQDPLPCLSQLANLCDLGLFVAYSGEQLVFLSGWFLKLKKLQLRGLPSLKRLEFHRGTMPRLEELVLANLPSMKEVPTGMEFLMSLRSLRLHEVTAELSASMDGFFEFESFFKINLT